MRQVELNQWAAGFYDAEGSSRIAITRTDEVNLGYGMTPGLEAKQRYFAGLFDGDGSAQVNARPSDSHAIDYDIRANFDVTVTKNDAFIQRLEAFSDGLGLSYSLDVYDSDACLKQTVKWRVHERESLRTLLPVLRRYCVIKKAQLAILEDEILPRLEEGAHRNRRGFIEIMAWKDVMDAYKGGQRGKYNLRYFEDLWEMKLDKERAGLPDGWEPDYSRPKKPNL